MFDFTGPEKTFKVRKNYGLGYSIGENGRSHGRQDSSGPMTIFVRGGRRKILCVEGSVHRLRALPKDGERTSLGNDTCAVVRAVQSDGLDRVHVHARGVLRVCSSVRLRRRVSGIPRSKPCVSEGMRNSKLCRDLKTHTAASEEKEKFDFPDLYS